MKVVNRCVETYLRCFTYDKPRTWCRWLPWAEYWYNTTFHASTNTTPFWAVYGRDPPPLIRYGSLETTIASVDQQLKERDLILDELKAHLLRAQTRMKMGADQHRRDIQFKEGDLVYVKLHSYRLRCLARKPNEKLCPKFFGPFKIISRIGPVAYHLELPSDATIHLKRHLERQILVCRFQHT